jgi:uncharacterized protein CbrC (UPF0167 family)
MSKLVRDVGPPEVHDGVIARVGWESSRLVVMLPVPAMSTPELPPEFFYYPDAVADGRIERSGDPCTACGRRRGWISTALLYTASTPDDPVFCPWCIADGTAVRRFGGTFNEIDDPIDPDVAAAVTERTPSFEAWQDWSWPTHCGRPAIYRGQPTGSQLRANPEALAAFLDLLAEEVDWSHDEAFMAQFMDGLGGSQAAYRFECPACSQQLMRWDCD